MQQKSELLHWNNGFISGYKEKKCLAFVFSCRFGLMIGLSWPPTGCCFYEWNALMPVCTCARLWNMDTCTHYYVSLCTCSEGRGWSRQSTGLMMGRERELQLHATPPWAPHQAPASALGLWCHLQSLGPTPGCGTRSFSSWLATGMPRE